MKVRFLVAVTMIILFVAPSAVLADWVKDVANNLGPGSYKVSERIVNEKGPKASNRDAKRFIELVNARGPEVGIYKLAITLEFIRRGKDRLSKKTLADLYMSIARTERNPEYMAEAENYAPGRHTAEMLSILYAKYAENQAIGGIGSSLFVSMINRLGGSLGSQGVSDAAVDVAIAKTKEGRTYEANKVLKIVTKKTAASKKLYAAGDKAEDEEMYSLYKLAYQLNPSKTDLSRKAGKRLADYAQSIEKDKKVFYQAAADAIRLSLSMLGESHSDPYTYITSSCNEVFNLNKDDWSGWFNCSVGDAEISYNFMSTNKHHEVYLSDGRKMKIWKGDKLPKFNQRTKFRYHALSDTKLKLVAESQVVVADK